MAAAVSPVRQPSTPEFGLSRSIRLIRVIVLLLGGIAITFSATSHEQLGFDLAIAAVMLAAIGAAHTIEWIMRRTADPVTLLLAIVSFVAAALLLLQGNPIGFAVVVAAWALVCALLEFVGNTVRPGSRQDAVLLGAAGVLLALLTLLLRNDEVAVVGLLGVYAIIAGVFLGISAFDIRRGSTPGNDLSGEQRAEHIAS